MFNKQFGRGLGFEVFSVLVRYYETCILIRTGSFEHWLSDVDTKEILHIY